MAAALRQRSRNRQKSEAPTFFDVFPEATIWSITSVVVAMTWSRAHLTRPHHHRCAPGGKGRQDHSRVTSLREVGFESTIDVLMAYRAGHYLRPWPTGAQPNLDRNLRLQYLAGMGVNSMAHAKIYDEMLAYRFYPSGLLTGPYHSTLNSLLQPTLR